MDDFLPDLTVDDCLWLRFEADIDPDGLYERIATSLGDEWADDFFELGLFGRYRRNGEEHRCAVGVKPSEGLPDLGGLFGGDLGIYDDGDPFEDDDEDDEDEDDDESFVVPRTGLDRFWCFVGIRDDDPPMGRQCQNKQLRRLFRAVAGSWADDPMVDLQAAFGILIGDDSPAMVPFLPQGELLPGLRFQSLRLRGDGPVVSLEMELWENEEKDGPDFAVLTVDVEPDLVLALDESWLRQGLDNAIGPFEALMGGKPHRGHKGRPHLRPV